MAIDKEIWAKAKALFELGYTLNEIELETEINKSSISKKAKKEGWTKSKNQPLKDEIVEYEKENSKIIQQKSTLVEKMAKLSDFEITILCDVVEEETNLKTLVTSTSQLALIRTNQLLTKNETYEKINVGDGVQMMQPRELNASDLKNIADTVDKISVTTKVNDRHAKSSVEVNNINAQQNNQEENITISIKE